MSEGRVVQFDEPRNLFERPLSTFVGYFIGNPGMNFVNCTLMETGLDCTASRYPLDPALVEKLRSYGDRFILGIRPEHTVVSGSRISSIAGRCLIVENLGSSLVLHVDLGGVTIKVKTQATDIAEGDAVYIKMPEEAVRIFRYPSGELLA